MKIKINDKEYGLSWGMGCLRLFCDEMGCDLEPGLELVMGLGEYTGLERSKSVPMLILCAIKNYAYVNREEIPDVTFEQIEAYRDYTQAAEFQLIVNDFFASMLQGQTVAERFGITTDTSEATEKAKKKSVSAKKSS